MGLALSRCDAVALGWRHVTLTFLYGRCNQTSFIGSWGRLGAMDLLASRLVTVSGSMARRLIARCQGLEF